MINKVILLGRCGKEPVTKTTESGKTLTAFSLATSEKYNGEESTTWHDVIFWGKTAEIAEKYVRKGDLLYIEGKINRRSYENKKGDTVYVTEIVGFTLQMLGNKKQTNENEQNNTEDSESPLPF